MRGHAVPLRCPCHGCRLDQVHELLVSGRTEAARLALEEVGAGHLARASGALHPDGLYPVACPTAACWAGGSVTAHARRCGCPLCIMADATLLLDRGKVGMAARVLEGLPAAMSLPSRPRT